MQMDENLSVDTATTEVVSNEPVGTSASWTESLAEDIRGEASLAKFKDINGLAKSYLSAEKMIGGSLRIPGEAATTEERESFYNKLSGVPGVVRFNPEDPESINSVYNKLGRPESADKYSLKALPTGEVLSDPQMQTFVDNAHKAGLTQSQMDMVMDHYSNIADANIQEYNASVEEAKSTLTKLWGNDFEKNQGYVQNALNSFKEQFPNEMDKLLRSPAANNPVILEAFAKLGRLTREGSAAMSGEAPRMATGAANAEKSIAAVLADRSHPFWKGDAKATAQMDTWYEQAYGGKR